MNVPPDRHLQSADALPAPLRSSQGLHIGFLHTSTDHLDHVGTILTRLVDRGHRVTVVNERGSSSVVIDGVAYPLMAPGDRDAVETIDLMICTSSGPRGHYPRRIRRLLIPHGMAFASTLGESAAFFHDFCHSDYLALPRALEGAPPKGLRIPHCLVDHGSPVVTVLPAGYPKLDMLARYCAQHPVRDDRGFDLMYSPTLARFAQPRRLDVAAYGIRIIEQLLRVEGAARVMFRPHPLDRNQPIVREIEEHFSDEPRFGIDRSASYLETYARTSLIVTDTWRTATTFSLATDRPTIALPMESAPSLIKGDLVMDERACVVVSNVDELASVVRIAMQARGQIATAIRKWKSEHLIRVGEAESYIVDCIERIMDGRPLAEWVRVDLIAPPEAFATPGEWEALISSLLQPVSFWFALEASKKAVELFARDPALWALRADALETFGLQREEAEQARRTSQALRESLADASGEALSPDRS